MSRASTIALLLGFFGGVQALADERADGLQARLDRLEAEIQAGEDLAAIKRLQRIYGYYLDKGMWEDLAALFTEDAVANYPAGVYVGRPSIRRHLYMNVGGGEIGENGLREGRLYNHMNLQPVLHLDPGGESAHGRWRAFAMFGGYGGGATWAEGIYQMTYAKEDGVWKIRTLDYHSGFAAPYDGGWSGAARGGGGGGRPSLPHPPDRSRNMACEGFPAACLVPFTYPNLGTPQGGSAWTVLEAARSEASNGASNGRANVRARSADLLHRATLLRDEQQIENLLLIYGYYLDRRMWDDIADLFAEDGTIEMELRGVYVGRDRIRRFLDLLGPQGLADGELNDRAHLQAVVHVAADGRTAWARSRELGMTGVYESHAIWSEGIYESTFAKQEGVWRFQSLRFYPTFISDYERGWAQDAQLPATVSQELPPDRPPSDMYEIYPTPHIPPYHYRNPVTGAEPSYPTGAHAPPADVVRAALMPEEIPSRRGGRARMQDAESALAEAERLIARVKDHFELMNLSNGYGYYLDKNLWGELADLFATDGSMELAQRGVYLGRDRVRGFLFNVFGPQEGPVENRLGNHLQMQPVIHVDDEGGYAQIRSRMMQQLSFGGRASMGAAVYENEAVKEGGVWKYRAVHAYNTWTAGYGDGWHRSASRGIPGPSADYPPDREPTMAFQMFPTVYQLPFHYDNPVSGRPSPLHPTRHSSLIEEQPRASSTALGMPAEIAVALREMGPVIDAQRTAALYAPLFSPEPYSGVNVARDVSYGPHERHVLDVFSPVQTGRARPVVVFIHGGGFTRGAKSAPDSPFYDNVMHWAATHGLVGVNMNYRLAPQHPWPSGVEDVSAVVRWVESNAAGYGGDPEYVFLWGHSAGAAHAADYVAHYARKGEPARIAGAILTSGFYDLGEEVGAWAAYYGDDVARYAERSSLPGLVQSDVPLLITDAELDPEMFRVEAHKLAAALVAAGRPVNRLHLVGHTHLSETYAVGTSDHSLSAPVLDFVRSIRRRR